ncbi:MAG: glycosyl transferase [Muribaculaceae bacterium]|nr:glycosyl transferase [Muribaculaceae bacterium]
MRNKFLELIKNPNKLFSHILSFISPLLSDRIYIILRYWNRTDNFPNLNNPQSFNEKLQWLKLNNRNPLYTKLVDKNLVKDHVSKIIGNDFIIKTLKVYNNPDEINYEELPDKFVMKCTHDSGGIIICKDKKNIDKNSISRKLNKNLKKNFYLWGREWPYKNVEKKIIVEEFIDNYSEDIKDYKFFCFDGEPKFLKVDYDRFKNHRANYYDLDWNLLTYGEKVCPPDFNHVEEKPDNFDLMIEIVKKLSKGFPFIRVDLYNVKGKIYFGELTFFPASGMGKWIEPEQDLEIGKFLKL